MKLGKQRIQIVNPPKVTWILVANRARGAIFRKTKGEKIEFLERFENPKGKLREQELVSDRPGKSQSSAGSGLPRHSLGKESVWHERAASVFAKSLIAAIDTGHGQGRFDELIIMAEPHFLGLLRGFIPKQLAHVPRRELGHELKFIDTKKVEKRVGGLRKQSTYQELGQ